jgi:hypothetical protein
MPGAVDQPPATPEGFLELILSRLATAEYRVLDDEGSIAVWPDGDLWGLGTQIRIPAFCDPGEEGVEDSDAPFVPIANGDFWGFVRQTAGIGVSGLSLHRTSVRFQYAGAPDELCAPLPSALLITEDQSVHGAIDQYGVVAMALRPVLPWRRYDRIDCVVAGDPNRPDVPLPFAPRRNGDRFWEVLGPNGERPLVFNIQDLGPWSPAEGALMVFSSREDALQGLAALRHRRWITRDRLPLDTEPSPQLVPITDLRDWMKREMARSRLNGAPFLVDAHLERHSVGVGNLEFGPFVRTTVGWWEVQAGNVLALDHVCHQWHGLDTFHWDGSFGWPAKLPKTTYHAAVSDRFAERFGTSRREQQRVVEMPELWSSPPPGDLADGYLVATTDRVTSDLTFRYFHDELSALAWLVRYESELDRSWRLDGRQEPGHPPTTPSGERDWEAFISTAFAVGASNLVARALTPPYSPRHARDIAGMCNQLLANLRVEICGYAIDVAHSLRENAEPRGASSASGTLYLQDLLYASLGLEAGAVQRELVEQGAYEVEPSVAQRCRAGIGDPAWDALSPESRSYLAAAFHHEDGHARDLRMDYAGYTIQLCRPLEFELVRAFKSARDRLGETNHLTAEDASPLARFLRGGRPPTLGEMVPYLANKPDSEYDCSAAPSFRSALKDLGAEVITSGPFLKKLRSLNQTVRRQTAHATPVSRADADRCAQLIIGDKGDVGLLPTLALALGPTISGRVVQPQDELAGRRQLFEDHVAVCFDRSELEARATDELDDATSENADPPESIADVQYVARIGDAISLFKAPNGLTYLITSVLAPNKVLDIVTREWLGTTVRRLERALSRRVVNWNHRNNTECLTDHQTGGLRLRFKLESGRWTTVSLDPAAADQLRSAIREITGGTWGHVADTPADVAMASTSTGLVERLWTEMKLERAQRTSSADSD